MNAKNKTTKIVMTAMFAALTCVLTMTVKIPSPLKGYVNIGDCAVLLAGWSLSPMYGFLATAVGSALADLFSGYAIYAPATFIIKGIMALIAYYASKLPLKKANGLFKKIVSGTAAELWMIIGYFVFEGFLYGFAPSLINIPANGVQGVAGVILGVILIRIFEKNKITFK